MSERPHPGLSQARIPLSGHDQILDVPAVMRLLGVNDARTARRTMREAGGFRVGRSYRLRASRLAAWIANQEQVEREKAAGPIPRGVSTDAWVGEIERLAR